MEYGIGYGVMLFLILAGIFVVGQLGDILNKRSTDRVQISANQLAAERERTEQARLAAQAPSIERR